MERGVDDPRQTGRHARGAHSPLLLARSATVIKRTLARVGEELAAAQSTWPPVIVIVGSVAAAPVCDWFASRPLFGTRVLVTRPVDQAETLCSRLTELGAECLVQPAIQIPAATGLGTG